VTDGIDLEDVIFRSAKCAERLVEIECVPFDEAGLRTPLRLAASFEDPASAFQAYSWILGVIGDWGAIRFADGRVDMFANEANATHTSALVSCVSAEIKSEDPILDPPLIYMKRLRFR
jgi:hypothetical protein